VNTSPVTPSIACATTDRACTSRPTLVRSMNTGASPHMSDRPGPLPGSPYPATHERCAGQAPARNPRQTAGATPYRLGAAFSRTPVAQPVGGGSGGVHIPCNPHVRDNAGRIGLPISIGVDSHREDERVGVDVKGDVPGRIPH